MYLCTINVKQTKQLTTMENLTKHNYTKNLPQEFDNILQEHNGENVSYIECDIIWNDTHDIETGILFGITPKDVNCIDEVIDDDGVFFWIDKAEDIKQYIIPTDEKGNIVFKGWKEDFAIISVNDIW